MHPVILVLLGTNPYSFERLARAVDELAGRRGWDIVMQTGHTPYRPKHGRHAAFVPRDEIRRLVQQCDMLITQGGAGSIHEGLAAGKPVIAVPRRPELGESCDRQEDLVRALEQQGRILAVYDVQHLDAAVIDAYTFRASAPPPNRIPSLITEFLETLP